MELLSTSIIKKKLNSLKIYDSFLKVKTKQPLELVISNQNK